MITQTKYSNNFELSITIEYYLYANLKSFYHANWIEEYSPASRETYNRNDFFKIISDDACLG